MVLETLCKSASCQALVRVPMGASLEGMSLSYADRVYGWSSTAGFKEWIIPGLETSTVAYICLRLTLARCNVGRRDSHLSF